MKTKPKELLTQEEYDHFWTNGYVIPKIRLSEEEGRLLHALLTFRDNSAGERMLGTDAKLGGSRMHKIACEIAEQLLGEITWTTRAIKFTKSAENNWLVPWHQDVTVAMPMRQEIPGYGKWTKKDGIWHAQPPEEVLRHMVAVRLHLDPCGPEDGPLRVIPGTHDRRIPSKEIDEIVASLPTVTLTVDPLQYIVMHPLVLHSSPKATGTSKRRVLHLECCALSVHPWRQLRPKASTAS